MVAPMKRFVAVVIALFFLVGLVLPAGAAVTRKTEAKGKPPGLELATLASQVTGIAISPLLGVSVVGAYKYFQANTPEEKARLPWFAQVSFWLPALLLVAACAFKDSFAAMVPPGLKKPLDAAEVVENKISGLVAAGAVIPSLVAVGSKIIAESSGLDQHFAVAGGFGMVQLGAVDFSWLLTILMVPLSIAVFAVVWVVGHAINVLMLLSPWGGVDTALKASRTAVLSLVAATAYIDPVVGATLSVVIIIISYFLAGWSFRLMIFGSVFSWDFFTLRRSRFQLFSPRAKFPRCRCAPTAVCTNRRTAGCCSSSAPGWCWLNARWKFPARDWWWGGGSFFPRCSASTNRRTSSRRCSCCRRATAVTRNCSRVIIIFPGPLTSA
jgi:hypothetical protein